MRICSIFGFLFFMVLGSSVFAMRPPAYLSVPAWQSCVASYEKRGAETVCLPSHKPLNCPKSSWNQLHQGTDMAYCPRVKNRYDRNMGSSAPQ